MMTSEYYEAIDNRRYAEVTVENRTAFTPKEFERIKRAINITGRPYRHLILFENRVGFISDDSEFNIQSISDEWYYVKFRANYFKCDQFDGLLKCLAIEIK